MSVVPPTLTLERRLLREHTLVIACDEVGRGALAGPVAVGAVADVGNEESGARVKSRAWPAKRPYRWWQRQKPQ